MIMPSTMTLTICISVLKRNRGLSTEDRGDEAACGLSLDIGSSYESAEHKTRNSNHESQKLDTISATN